MTNTRYRQQRNRKTSKTGLYRVNVMHSHYARFPDSPNDSKVIFSHLSSSPGSFQGFQTNIETPEGARDDGIGTRTDLLTVDHQTLIIRVPLPPLDTAQRVGNIESSQVGVFLRHKKRSQCPRIDTTISQVPKIVHNKPTRYKDIKTLSLSKGIERDFGCNT